MGIHGIYKEIGPGERVALSRLAVEKFEQTGRPLRIAIDTSIWLFQIQSSKGGTNPALRTFYYRLLRLLSLSIHPLFVFDGPNKPPFKRNRRTGPNVASIPEFLAKQLLKQFGFPFHLAPGEAEAECALLQREGIVDAVLSEDVDTLMFGSAITLRNWSPESKASKVPTHVNMYDEKKTKAGPAGLDRDGMILVALMSGGDYLPEGIPGCGPKIACEAARAGFGQKLCAISKRDAAAVQEWKEDLAHELRTNESKFFKRKHGALAIPEDFPRADILGYYTNPAISSRDSLERLKRNLRWDQDLNFAELRTFTGDAFDWVKLGGAKKFIRNLAPALLVRQLRMRGQAAAQGSLSEEIETTQAEGKLVTSIHGKRQHPSTDNTTELRVAYTPVDIVNIDLDAEEPDDELEKENDDDDEEMPVPVEEDVPAEGEVAKKRGPSLYDPTKTEKTWVLESFVKVGVPLKAEDWEESQRKKAAPKQRQAKVTKPSARPKKAATAGGMQRGALDRFAKISKAGAGLARQPEKPSSASIDRLDLSGPPRPTSPKPRVPRNTSKAPPSPRTSKEPLCIDLLSSSPAVHRTASQPTVDTLDEHYLFPNMTKRARTLRRTQTAPGGCEDDLPRPSQSAPAQSEALLVAGDVFTSSVLPSVRELGSAQQLQKPQAENFSIRPPAARGHREKANVTSPSRRQMTVHESFSRFQRATPLKARHANATDVSGREAPPMLAAEEVEELDRSSQFAPKERGASRSTRSSGKCTREAVESGADGALQPTTGNASRTGRRSKDAPSDAAPSKQAPPTETSKASAGGNTADVRRSPRQHGATAGFAERGAVGKAVDAGSETGLGRAAADGARKRKTVVKLRESLEGSWKFVDVEVEQVEAGRGSGAPGMRRGAAWRRSEVEVLDLTNG